MDVDREDPWVYIPELWPTTTDLRGKDETVYQVLLDECREYLSQGDVVLFGQVHKEGRLTALFSNEDAVMKYSGRQVKPVKPKEGSYMSVILECFQDENFLREIEASNPRLYGKLPKFNAIFMNWYRPPTETEKPDGLGKHADDEKSLTSPVIVSVTFCEPHGERLFSFHEKATDKTVWEKELADGSGLVMMDDCQKRFKHSVSNRKTNSQGKIVGGRINLTFRQIEVEGKAPPRREPLPSPVRTKLTLFCKVREQNGYLSNWYESPITIGGQQFLTVEHYMMWSKAILFNDNETAKKVLATDSPAEVKKLGRGVKNFDEVVWKQNCVRIVLEGNIAKFQQHPNLAKRLLETGESFIAESADYDTVWGIGLSTNDPRAQDMTQWRGYNYLGKILHDVRRRLQGYKSPLQQYADDKIATYIAENPRLDWLGVWQKLATSFQKKYPANN